MKQIFYSLMAMALCACSQSEIEDVVTPPQPEKNGLKFEVVDNGFVDKDGTRVSYGDYDYDNGATAAAYTATFEKGDAIGIYAIKVSEITETTDENGVVTGVPSANAYTVRNVKVTLKDDNVWTSEPTIDLNDLEGATLLFAYAPYSETDYTAGSDGTPMFTKVDGKWEVNLGNNRFFVGFPHYTVTDNGSKEAFEKADMMGATYTLTGTENETATFNMKHVRGMVEVTTNKYVDLTELKLSYTSTPFKPYLFATTKTQKVYRILTTEYRGQFTVKATIQDRDVVKKYTATIKGRDAGWCSRLNIKYTPEGVFTVDKNQSLADLLAEKYGTEYASNAALSALYLNGELTDTDWQTLLGLQHLEILDMSSLSNTKIPASWMAEDTTLRTTLTKLVLPDRLITIEANALQFDSNTAITIELPASVKEIGDQAFINSNAMKVRIPEDSELETIGSYAFFGLKTVYNDPNSTNSLRIPETVSSISGGAFANMSELRYVFFQSETAPATENTDIFGNTLITTIYVPNSANYKNKGFFPGKSVIAGPVLTVDNYKAVDKDGKSFTETTEGSLSALCDGPQNTYWHSDYHNAHNYNDWGIYIDIALPKAYSNLKLSYTTRCNGNAQVPKKVRIGVATDSGAFAQTNVYDATTDATVLPTAMNTTKELAISTTSSYNKVRFGVIVSAIGTAAGDGVTVWTALSELRVYEDMWTDAAAQ